MVSVKAHSEVTSAVVNSSEPSMQTQAFRSESVSLRCEIVPGGAGLAPKSGAEYRTELDMAGEGF